MPQFQNLRANIPAPICPGTDSPPRSNFLLRGAGPASPFPRLASGAPPYRVTSLLSQHPSRTRIFSRASPQKQESAAAFRSSLARPASPVRAPAVSHSAAPHAVCSPTPPAAAGNPRTPARLCSCRFLRLRSRTSLPLTAEESPHASSSLPALHLRPFARGLRPAPSLRAPSLRPQSRSLQPSASNRPPFPRVRELPFCRTLTADESRASLTERHLSFRLLPSRNTVPFFFSSAERLSVALLSG